MCKMWWFMDARLVRILLRCVQSDTARFPVTSTLASFVNDYGYRVGAIKGKSIYMDSSQKQTIRDILSSDGVAADTSPDAWDGLTRAEALLLGHNEKFANEPVKRRRAVIKPLRPDLPLILNGRELRLPARCHVEVDYDGVGQMKGHDWIVVVENWECFNDIHIAADRLSFPGQNPLIVWRGDKDGVRANDMLAMLRNLSQPVAAFVDYDPSGMVIAKSLPRLSYIVAPTDLTIRLKEEGLHDRYMVQLPVCQASLNESKIKIITDVWNIICGAARALPQEWFVRLDTGINSKEKRC